MINYDHIKRGLHLLTYLFTYFSILLWSSWTIEIEINRFGIVERYFFDLFDRYVDLR